MDSDYKSRFHTKITELADMMLNSYKELANPNSNYKASRELAVSMLSIKYNAFMSFVRSPDILYFKILSVSAYP